MASFSIFTLFFIITTLTNMVSTDFLSPLLSPVVSDLCKQVGCGRGKCKMSDNNDLQYKCECDPGWKQTLSSNASAFNFLPCVIPNCTIDYSCSRNAPPARSQETQLNTSIIEPCHWVNCGGGVCNKTSALMHKCVCNEGYYNLFNNTLFPCYMECSIGGDCSNLGISVSNTSTTPAPSLGDSGSHQGKACLLRQGVYYQIIVFLLISVALAL